MRVISLQAIKERLDSLIHLHLHLKFNCNLCIEFHLFFELLAPCALQSLQR